MTEEPWVACERCRQMFPPTQLYTCGPGGRWRYCGRCVNEAEHRTSKPVTPLDVELTETAELLAQMPDGRIGRYGTAVGIRYLEGLLRRASERVSPETSDRLRTAEIILAQALQCDGYTEQHGEWMRQAIEFLGLRTSVKASEHLPGCWKLQSPSGRGVCNCGAESEDVR